VSLDAYIQQNGLEGLDLLKIDIDGLDLKIMHALKGRFVKLGLVAVLIESNLFGTDSTLENSIHNVDYFLKSEGLDLVQMTPRRYTSAALPGQFILPRPSETYRGRLYQADLLYVLDVCEPRNATIVADMEPHKLLKLAGILTHYSLEDMAAEIFVRFRDRLAPLIDVDVALDRLAAIMQSDRSRPLKYSEFLASFQRGDDWFYPARRHDLPDAADLRIGHGQALIAGSMVATMETLPLTSLAGTPFGTVKLLRTEARVTSGPEPWAWMTTLKLPQARCPRGYMAVEIDLQFDREELHVTLVSEEEQSIIVQRRAPPGRCITVRLECRAEEHPGYLVLRKGEGPVAPVVDVHAVRVYHYN
jgi:hypothetical protein